MNKVIIIRYCEIYLKKKNRSYFERLLADNIKNSLRGIKHKFVRIPSRYLIENFDDCDYEEIISRLSKVSGVHTVSPAYIVKNDKDEIYNTAIELCEGKSGTFKVETNRADKTFPIRSVDLSRDLGGVILSKYHKNLSVKIKNPDFVVSIDIRESGDTLIYTDVIKCMSGMPVGSAGKGLLLLSGGIDSPVAGYLMAKRGMKLKALHFHSYPYTSDAAKEKVIELAKGVSAYSAGLDLYVVSVTEIQEAIHEHCQEDFMITILRRFMMRIAERLAVSIDAQAIITGESLGQVASQTIESLTSSNSVVTMPVLRPLIAFDKLDIIAIAEKINTFETSILPYEDCCTVFLPKSPVTKPKLEKVQKVESVLDVEKLIENALLTIEKISI